MSQKSKLVATGLIAIAFAMAGMTVVITPASAMLDQNEENNIRCIADPHDPRDTGNSHEPPNNSGNPHFCPPIGSL